MIVVGGAEPERMIMARLAGKVAIVTGASSGIGREAALLFASEGANVVIAARRKHLLDRLVDEITGNGGTAVAAAGDVCDESYVKELVATASKTFGGLDIAFNNAGTLGVSGDISSIPLEAWMHTLTTNLTSAFLSAKYQVPAMVERGSGSIIFTSSFVGLYVGLPGMAAYAASKAGLAGLARVLAAQYGPNRIRVNILSPGGTATAMAEQFIDSPETEQFVQSIHALKRIARPTEIAQAALFLASEESSFVTGSILSADGGVSICKT
jgi:NAD(P)-dependent dehydrogenase (short-subunit alcohol dehydrogenase family)